MKPSNEREVHSALQFILLPKRLWSPCPLPCKDLSEPAWLHLSTGVSSEHDIELHKHKGSLMLNELRSPLAKGLAARTCSTQTPGGAGVRELLALARLSWGEGSGWLGFHKLALMTCHLALGSRYTKRSPARSA